MVLYLPHFLQNIIEVESSESRQVSKLCLTGKWVCFLSKTCSNKLFLYYIRCKTLRFSLDFPNKKCAEALKHLSFYAYFRSNCCNAVLYIYIYIYIVVTTKECSENEVLNILNLEL